MTTQVSGCRLLLTLSGTASMGEGGHLRQVIAEAVATAGVRDVVVNATRVSGFDSSAIAGLIAARKSCEGAGGLLVVVAPTSSHAGRVLNLTAVNLPREETLAQALDLLDLRDLGRSGGVIAGSAT